MGDPTKPFTAADFDDWIPARQAFEKAAEAYGKVEAARLILAQLSDVLIIGRARSFFRDPDTKNTDYGPGRVIPTEVWKELASEDLTYGLTLWKSSSIEVDVYANYSSGSVSASYRLYDVRFDPDGVRKMLPKPTGAVPSETSPPAKHGGGAPSKDFWPDLWIAIAVQLYNGDLQPIKQADIENAMLSWASDNGHELSEATARRYAPRLWKLIKKEGS